MGVEYNSLPDIPSVDEMVAEFGRFLFMLVKVITEWNNR